MLMNAFYMTKILRLVVMTSAIGLFVQRVSSETYQDSSDLNMPSSVDSETAVRRSFEAMNEAMNDSMRQLETVARPNIRDFRTYDPDPTGMYTDLEGRRRGLDWGTNYVRGIVVAGKWMTAEELSMTEEGTELLEIAIRARHGTKRGFWDEICDTDDFFVLFEKPIEYYKVSKIKKKMFNDDFVSNEERLKVGLFDAKRNNPKWNQRTWCGMVGYIVKVFMGSIILICFLCGLFTWIRTILTKCLVRGMKGTSREPRQ